MTTTETKASPPDYHRVESRPISRAAKRLRRRAISQTYWAAEQDGPESHIDIQRRLSLVSRHGHFSLAYSTAVQPRLMYFGDDDGYIAYRRRWGFDFVLGDIVAPPGQQEKLLDRFLAKHHGASFCQISRRLASMLSDRGFLVNEMGLDTTLDLSSYDFAGKRKEWLRYAHNWMAKRQYQIVEGSFDEFDLAQVELVSEAWRKTRTIKRKEVRFLNRPIVMQDEPDVRKFFLLSPDDKLLAFVFLDPIYRDNQVAGYVTAFKRRHPDAPLYAEQAIMKHMIEKLQDEGVPCLRLGLSPLAGIEDNEFKCNKLTSWMFRRAFNAKWVNRYFYNVVGHAEYKQRFRGNEEKVYFASSARWHTPRMLALVGLCGIA